LSWIFCLLEGRQLREIYLSGVLNGKFPLL